jgi:hypothetical protein
LITSLADKSRRRSPSVLRRDWADEGRLNTVDMAYELGVQKTDVFCMAISRGRNLPHCTIFKMGEGLTSCGPLPNWLVTNCLQRVVSVQKTYLGTALSAVHAGFVSNGAEISVCCTANQGPRRKLRFSAHPLRRKNRYVAYPERRVRGHGRSSLRQKFGRSIPRRQQHFVH